MEQYHEGCKDLPWVDILQISTLSVLSVLQYGQGYLRPRGLSLLLLMTQDYKIISGEGRAVHQ